VRCWTHRRCKTRKPTGTTSSPSSLAWLSSNSLPQPQDHDPPILDLGIVQVLILSRHQTHRNPSASSPTDERSKKPISPLCQNSDGSLSERPSTNACTVLQMTGVPFAIDVPMLHSMIHRTLESMLNHNGALCGPHHQRTFLGRM
jgi:hypothetical protein